MRHSPIFRCAAATRVAQQNRDRPWEEVADQFNERVIKRVIQHDLRVGERGRKRDESLLEELFRLRCRYSGQSPRPAHYATELRQSLNANGGQQRVN